MGILRICKKSDNANKRDKATEKGQIMMSWEQLDKLHEVAENTTLTADQRVSVISDFMRLWGMLVNEVEPERNPSKYMMAHETDTCTLTAPIDPYTQSAPMPHLTGDSDNKYYPDFAVDGPTWWQNSPTHTYQK
jgi:hypothetical protein